MGIIDRSGGIMVAIDPVGSLLRRQARALWTVTHLIILRLQAVL